ncbi:hypothetical protein V6N13_084715 [Hibiscus sabdariffa]
MYYTFELGKSTKECWTVPPLLASVEDEEAFNVSIRNRFVHLDSNYDGLSAYTELLKELQSLRVPGTNFGIDVKMDPNKLAYHYQCLFVQFDHDSNRTVS